MKKLPFLLFILLSGACFGQIKSVTFQTKEGANNMEIIDPVGVSGSLPAVIFIPGWGEVGTNRELIYAKQGPFYLYRNAGQKPTNYRLVGIQPRDGYAGPDFINAALTELSKPEYKISTFIGTGLSAGAWSWLTYVQTATNPFPLQAIIPMSIAPEYDNITAPFASVPSWFFCGDDPQYNSMKAFWTKLYKAGYNTKWSEPPGGHDPTFWNKAYSASYKENGQNIYEWALSQPAKPITGTPVDPPVVVPPVVVPPVVIPGSAKRKIITPSEGGKFINASYGLLPGDTAVLQAGPWSTYFSLDGVNGSATNPIVIINEGGQVNLRDGFGITNCTYLKITGSGSNDQYGFKIKDTKADAGGPGVSITGKSAFVEVERLFINHKEYGFWIKNEADCDESLNYPNWWIDGIHVHDCYIRQMDSQGFYMGTTDPNNLDRPIVCNGVTQYYTPTRLRNIRIINNIIDSTGRPGIQLSVAMQGANEIAYNKVSNTGFQFDDAQGTGISLGGYTRAYVHHNTIRRTWTWGIASLGGSGLLRIEDNDIDSSGYLAGKTLPGYSPIIISTRTTTPTDSTYFQINKNSLGISTAPYYIGVDDPKKSMGKVGNGIQSNTAKKGSIVLSVESGIQYAGGPIVVTYQSKAVSKSFTRSNCPTGNTPGSATYTVAAGKYNSTISQADADSKATADINANGQAYANSTATCTPVATKTVLSVTTINGKTITIYTDGTVQIK
jgi:hypothetical protein